MNRHDDAEQRVGTWLHDEAQGELPDWVLDQTFETTRSTRQRNGLRGWLASIARRDGSSTRGRSNVFNLAGMTAVAVTAVLATGVVINLAQEQTQAPGAEAPTVTVEESVFTGRFTYGPICQDEGGNEIDYCWRQTDVVFDDPRFQGAVQMTANADYSDLGIYRNSFSITTEDGAWQSGPTPGILTDDGVGAPSVHLFTGEGDYEGLFAVAAVTLEQGQFRLKGHVVEGGFPELPER